ncbi:g8186 [Coccomyxa viridis]|uniref:G8186 protein n=1 Tax=Coccomyxa viridis TaxID=1274662 RepID=A0ABP1FZT0_9CHLO
MLHRRGLTALFSALCLILQLSWGEGLRIALIPDPQEEVINPFAHELAAYAAGLGMLKHNVTLLPDVEDDETTLDGLLGSSNRTEDAYYDAILTQGTKAALIADYAARLHIPVVRFISKGAAVGAAAPHPLYERPAALVFASEEDEHAFDIDQMAEALRLVISPAKTRIAISSGAAYSAVDKLVREVLQTYNPHPDLEQKTLGLVMIVKDEVATINITLGSMRDHIDDWTIVDTGSTDGTQARHHALTSM